MKTLMTMILFSVATSAFAGNVYGWKVECHNGKNVLRIDPSDDEASVSSEGPDLGHHDGTLYSVGTFDQAAKTISFKGGKLIITIVRNSTGVGTGKATLKGGGATYPMLCRVGYIPYEDGPTCFDKESLKNPDCK